MLIWSSHLTDCIGAPSVSFGVRQEMVARMSSSAAIHPGRHLTKEIPFPETAQLGVKSSLIFLQNPFGSFVISTTKHTCR